MCDRSKSEILARELCIEVGVSMGLSSNDLKSFVEKNYQKRINYAKKLLCVLSEHKN